MDQEWLGSPQMPSSCTAAVWLATSSTPMILLSCPLPYSTLPASCPPVVVYLCCPWDIFRTLMVQFWLEGVHMEDYVFFFIDLFAEGLGGRGPARPWYRGDQDDSAAHQAFKVIQLLNCFVLQWVFCLTITCCVCCC